MRDRRGLSGIRPPDPGAHEYDCTTQIVRTAPLDDEVRGPIVFVKIDVEGAEYDVLRGAEQTLARYEPVVLFEYGKSGYKEYDVTPGELFSLFDGLSYALFTLQQYLTDGTSLRRQTFRRMVADGAEWEFVADGRGPEPEG